MTAPRPPAVQLYPTDPAPGGGVHRDLSIVQGADWAGERFYIVDAAGQPVALDPDRCSAQGWIGELGRPIYAWSWPVADDDSGPVRIEHDTVTPSVPAEHTLLWRFTAAPYQLFFTNPDAPPGQRRIRVGYGTVRLDRRIAP